MGVDSKNGDFYTKNGAFLLFLSRMVFLRTRLPWTRTPFSTVGCVNLFLRLMCIHPDTGGNHERTFVLTGCPKTGMRLKYVYTPYLIFVLKVRHLRSSTDPVHPAAGLSSRSRETPRSLQRVAPRTRPLLVVFFWSGPHVMS
jgi:hypothetical protein